MCEGTLYVVSVGVWVCEYVNSLSSNAAGVTHAKAN